jgi:hypothetical protein
MLTIEQKLNQLYLATRVASLNADQHTALQQYAQDILEEIKAKEAQSNPPDLSENA